MMHLKRWTDNNEFNIRRGRPFRKLSALKFFMRYPIFLLVFGPPIFRYGSIDATRGHIDIWSFIQVGWIGAIAFRAIMRLLYAQSVPLPRQIRAILNLALFLGIVYLLSATYSTSPPVSAAYAVLYFLSWICVVEFIVDVGQNPPDWMQCIFQLRLISLLQFALVIVTGLVDAKLVLTIEPGAGLRLSGGAVAPIGGICSTIALISAYSFLRNLESRVRSGLLFLVGFGGVLSEQSRGAELALLLCLAILGVGWAQKSKRAAFTALFWFCTFMLAAGVIIGAFGGGHLWELFNRNEDAVDIRTASGRTVVWAYILRYCLVHPQGMGYIAGFKDLFRNYFAFGIQIYPAAIGTAHNSFMQVLADAGWLALAIYLTMITMVVRIGWRNMKRDSPLQYASGNDIRYSLECALLLLISCFSVGMDTDEFSVPMRVEFYFQLLLIGIILSISTRAIVISRSYSLASSKQVSEITED